MEFMSVEGNLDSDMFLMDTVWAIKLRLVSLNVFSLKEY